MNYDILHLSFNIPAEDYSFPELDDELCRCDIDTTDCKQHSYEPESN